MSAAIFVDIICFDKLHSYKTLFESNVAQYVIQERHYDTNPIKNYLFNTKIKNIEESDLIILIGTNPRFEATILNSRIRKAFINNKTAIFSTNDVGDLTYPYKFINGDTETIKNISEDNHDLSEKIKNSTKPLIIFGQSSLLLKSFGFIFESLKTFLIKNNHRFSWDFLKIKEKRSSSQVRSAKFVV